MIMHKDRGWDTVEGRLVPGVSLVIRQVDLGREATIAIRGSQVNLSPSTNR
jgi:hypothetical protein